MIHSSLIKTPQKSLSYTIIIRFNCWFRFDSKSNDQIVSSIAILSFFRIKSITFDLILIKRSKESIKRSKKSIYIKKVDIFQLFDFFRSLLIWIWSLSIYRDFFNTVRTWFNWFRRNDYLGFQEFGSKFWFKHNTNTIKTDSNSQVDLIA